MATTMRKPLDYYLSLQYPFNVIADPDGGYVIVFPDLPGCMTQVETLDEIPAMAAEVRRLWIETEYQEGEDIPLPSYPEEYSGKFNLRLPRSLHRAVAEEAKRQGMSLNSYVQGLLARGDAQARVEHRLTRLEERVEQRIDHLEERLRTLDTKLRYRVRQTSPRTQAESRSNLMPFGELAKAG